MEIQLPVTPIDLTEDERLELEDCMGRAYTIFKQATQALYQSSDPADVRRLRSEYLEGEKKVCKRKRVTAAMIELQSLELRIMAGYIRIALGYVKSVYLTNRTAHPDLSTGDYLTEAMWGIWDAMYTFDLERGYRFASYMGGVVKNRLINFIRTEERTAGIGRDIKALRKRVKEVMREKAMCMEEALTVLIKDGEVPPELADSIRQAMAFFVHHTTLHERTEQVDQNREAMWEAIRLADLTPLERELMDAHLNNDRGYRSRMAEERINPNTGKLYTKMALTHVWQRACEKVRDVYNGKRKVA